MSARRSAPWLVVVVLGAVIGLPLAGAWLRDPAAAAAAFRFPPPLEIPATYPRWSWVWASGYLVPFLALAAACWRARHRRPREVPHSRTRRGGRFPIWGWVALAWVAVWWSLAWTRFTWFAPVQLYTFFPLWLGFIVAINALTMQRSGDCLMRRRPLGWCALFGISAAFWWVFEWLNRFVHSWHYLGVQEFGAAAYALHASVCFSTVLPAVTAVRECLGTFPPVEAGLATGPRLGWLVNPTVARLLVAASLAALLLTGARPAQLYGSLWLAPVALWTGLAVLGRREGFWGELAAGDWRHPGAWALAAFVCGGFWELWNFHSAAKWIYTVPYVDRWHVFEMPLLGYLGYFAFGLECAVIAGAILPRDPVTYLATARRSVKPAAA